MKPIKRILVPIDFSERSQQALPLARQLAGPDCEMHMLHINQPSLVYAHAGAMLPPASVRGRPTWDQLRSKLKAVGDQLERPAGKIFHHVVENNSPASSIIDYAAEHDIDLIVMTTHGTTGLARLLMGSVAEQVVREAECPVLTLKVADTEE